jgi:hypothetical protein
MSYKKGEILICTNNKYNSNLIIGDKYEIIDFTRFVTDGFIRCSLDIRHLNSGKSSYWCDDRSFISLEVWREFQLRKVLN